MSWIPDAEMATRNAAILEATKAGMDRYDLAIRFDLTPQRISQIVNKMGYSFARGAEVMSKQ